MARLSAPAAPVALALGFLLIGLGVAASVGRAAQPPGDWKPAAYSGESTIRLRTTDPAEGEHWFPVWLVVLDGDVYVRLGSVAAGRIQRNTTNPYIAVQIAGQEFDHVKFTETPDHAEKVAKAMGDKYWSDVAVRYFSHPMTLRLRPE
jgi:hypothetical protein